MSKILEIIKTLIYMIDSSDSGDWRAVCSFLTHFYKVYAKELQLHPEFNMKKFFIDWSLSKYDVYNNKETKKEQKEFIEKENDYIFETFMKRESKQVVSHHGIIRRAVESAEITKDLEKKIKMLKRFFNKTLEQFKENCDGLNEYIEINEKFFNSKHLEGEQKVIVL